MSQIRNFRINGFDNVTNRVEFYFKADRQDGSLICNFCVDDDGVHCYAKGSRILTPKENKNTRSTVTALIAMEDLAELFKALRKAGLHGWANDGDRHLKITRRGKKVIIEEADLE
jgi:hypothetical protein